MAWFIFKYKMGIYILYLKVGSVVGHGPYWFQSCAPTSVLEHSSAHFILTLNMLMSMSFDFETYFYKKWFPLPSLHVFLQNIFWNTLMQDISIAQEEACMR